MVASAMDLIFAADDSMFLGGGFQYFSPPWDIHPRKVKEILFEGRIIDAEETRIWLGESCRATLDLMMK